MKVWEVSQISFLTALKSSNLVAKAREEQLQLKNCFASNANLKNNGLHFWRVKSKTKAKLRPWIARYRNKMLKRALILIEASMTSVGRMAQTVNKLWALQLLLWIQKLSKNNFKIIVLLNNRLFWLKTTVQMVNIKCTSRPATTGKTPHLTKNKGNKKCNIVKLRRLSDFWLWKINRLQILIRIIKSPIIRMMTINPPKVKIMENWVQIKNFYLG